MAQRITRKNADAACRTLNEMLALPTEPMGERLFACENTHRWNIGNIHITGVYGRLNIDQVSNDAGACRSLACGLTTREAWEWISAAMAGIQLCRKHCKDDPLV